MVTELNAPTIDISHDGSSFCFTVLDYKIITDPRYEMIFKSAFDDLME